MAAAIRRRLKARHWSEVTSAMTWAVALGKLRVASIEMRRYRAILLDAVFRDADRDGLAWTGFQRLDARQAGLGAGARLEG